MAHKWLKWPMPPTSSATETLGRQFLSRHFSPQNCQFGGAESRLSTDPAIFPASLRDSQASGIATRKSCRFLCRNGRKLTRSRTWRPGSCIGGTEAEKLSSIIDHAVLKNNGYKISTSRLIEAIDAQSCETDKASKGMLEKVGV